MSDLPSSPTPEGESMNDETEREIFEYLDALRKSGATNMYGAGAYLEDEFSMERETAMDYLLKWIQTFGERHPQTADKA